MQTKHMPRAPGVYQIRNIVNGKIYAGSAVDIQKRIHGHKRAGLSASVSRRILKKLAEGKVDATE